MKFLNPDERIVLNKIIFKKGSCLQSEITRLKEMTKLRTHRAVKSLESKDIIVSEEQGKTNKLSLAKDIRDVLLK